MENRKFNLDIAKLIVPVASVLIAMIIGSLLLLVSGISPIALFKAIAQGISGNLNGLVKVTSMLIFTGLAIGFSYKGGLFNIGAEGQFIMASLVAAMFAVASPLPSGATPIVGLLIGFIVGAIWAFLPGILKALYGISEVVVTIMLNWVAMYLFDFIVQGNFNQVNNTQQTPIIEPSKQLLLSNGFSYAIIIALVAAFMYWFVLEKTAFGYEIKAIGHSKDIAAYTGIKSKARTVQTMMISGGFAGLAGATYALSYGYMSTIGGNYANYGFDGIAVALLGGLNSFGIIISSILMGVLRNAEAAFGINRIPSEISDIIIGLIILFSVIGPIVYKKIQKRGA